MDQLQSDLVFIQETFRQPSQGSDSQSVQFISRAGYSILEYVTPNQRRGIHFRLASYMEPLLPKSFCQKSEILEILAIQVQEMIFPGNLYPRRTKSRRNQAMDRNHGLPGSKISSQRHHISGWPQVQSYRSRQSPNEWVQIYSSCLDSTKRSPTNFKNQHVHLWLQNNFMQNPLLRMNHSRTRTRKMYRTNSIWGLFFGRKPELRTMLCAFSTKGDSWKPNGLPIYGDCENFTSGLLLSRNQSVYRARLLYSSIGLAPPEVGWSWSPEVG